MTFPIASIAKFLMQLAILTPAVNDSIDRVRHLIETIRKPAGTRGGTGQAIRERNHSVRLSNLANLDNFVSLLLLGIAWRVVQGFWLPEFYIT
jgi:hypothetical protein